MSRDFCRQIVRLYKNLSSFRCKIQQRRRNDRMKEIKLCGVRIDNLPLSDAVIYALQRKSRPCFTVTPNAVMLDACKREPRYAAILNTASLSLPDGCGVLWAARRKGTPLRERVAGIEFGEKVLQAAADKGLRVFLLGGERGVAKEAAENLCKRYPGLQICGSYHGYFQKRGRENDPLLRYIRLCKPDVLFVCLGFPLQEIWCCKNLMRLSSIRLVACLGGSLDVWAEKVRRAPALLSKCGLEWAWRMLHEPKRLKNLPALVRFACNS